MGALEKGDFYSSEGPEIHEISLDGNLLTVRTSSAVSIDLTTDRRISKRRCGEGTLTEATFDLTRWLAGNADAVRAPYFRVTVKDASGRNAWSRAYFWDELEISETEE